MNILCFSLSVFAIVHGVHMDTCPQRLMFKTRREMYTHAAHSHTFIYSKNIHNTQMNFTTYRKTNVITF